MNVLQIHNQIARVSIETVSEDLDLSNHILDSINRAYRDIHAAARNDSDALLETQDVTLDANGSATMNPVPQYVVAVKHQDRPGSLGITSRAKEIMFDTLSETGQPNRYFLVGSTIQVIPKGTAGDELTLVYVPKVEDLTLASTEADIKGIPEDLHDVLFWGGVYYLGLYERGFTSARMSAQAQQEYELKKSRVLMHMRGDNQPPQTTEVYY